MDAEDSNDDELSESGEDMSMATLLREMNERSEPGNLTFETRMQR